ncbi:MAG: hypothetical protein QOE70_2674 [Chthoniobacter sp.]|jgi:hypothetical protein|nr:hypothetical protein [Chthoniobacter sp.]
MKTICSLLGVLALLATASAQQVPPREEWYRGLDLEEAAARAELILAARVEEVTEVRLVSGGKGESTTLQVRFKPVRVVKGVFARPELILGSSELASYNFAGQLKQIKGGQTRLLFLGRNEVGYQNIQYNARSLDHAIPPLTGENDPLLQAITALLAADAEPDRSKRVGVLTAALTRFGGPAAVPILSAVSRRALLAAQRPPEAPAILRHLGDPSPAVRIAAASTLQAILAADYLNHAELRDGAAEALKTGLEREGANIAARTALIAATGELGAIRDPALIARLDFAKPARSLAERNAQIEAVGRLRLAAFADRLFVHSQSLPPDLGYHDPTEIALARVDAARGAAEIERHAREKIAAGLSCNSELRSATALPDPDAAVLLVRLAELPLDSDERRAFATAALTLCERNPHERLVSPLSRLLDPDEPGTRAEAISALLLIGSRSAAEALQPRLAQEKNLSEKLRIAALLGKHGMRDGYPYAIEHVSEPYLTDLAVTALVAMNDPRTTAEARKILETSNDAKWNGAAIRVLGALGASDLAPKFLLLASDWKNPLAPAALVALADLGERQVLPGIHEALGARGDELVIAGARAAGRLLAVPGVANDEIRDQLAALLGDSSASVAARKAALEALVALQDPRLDRALIATVTDATLEKTSLLTQVEQLARERKLKLP